MPADRPAALLPRLATGSPLSVDCNLHIGDDCADVRPRWVKRGRSRRAHRTGQKADVRIPFKADSAAVDYLRMRPRRAMPSVLAGVLLVSAAMNLVPTSARANKIYTRTTSKIARGLTLTQINDPSGPYRI